MIDSEFEEIPIATIIQIAEPVTVNKITIINYKVCCVVFIILGFYLYMFIKIE